MPSNPSIFSGYLSKKGRTNRVGLTNWNRRFFTLIRSPGAVAAELRYYEKPPPPSSPAPRRNWSSTFIDSLTITSLTTISPADEGSHARKKEKNRFCLTIFLNPTATSTAFDRVASLERGFTVKRVEEYRRLFRTVDSDGSGEIDEGEVEEVRRGEGGGEKARMGGWFCCVRLLALLPSFPHGANKKPSLPFLPSLPFPPLLLPPSPPPSLPATRPPRRLSLLSLLPPRPDRRS